MTCPKCKNDHLPDDATHCDVCHTVFKKAAARPAAPPAAGASAGDELAKLAAAAKTPEDKAKLRHLAEKMTAHDFLPKKPSGPLFKVEEFYAALAFAFVFALYWSWDFRRQSPYQYPSGWLRAWISPFIVREANLVFHEAGHPIFGILFFGNEFMTSFGGSAMQVIVPLVCLGKFWWDRSRWGVIACVHWVGTNLIDTGQYASDAKTLDLPLISGMTGAESTGHDYMNMLDYWNIDRGMGVTFGLMMWFMGFFLMGTAMVMAAKEGWKLYNDEPLAKD